MMLASRNFQYPLKKCPRIVQTVENYSNTSSKSVHITFTNGKENYQNYTFGHKLKHKDSIVLRNAIGKNTFLQKDNN